MSVRSTARRGVVQRAALSAVAAAALLSACAGRPERSGPPAPVERFVTNITADGVKQFNFDLSFPSSPNGRGGGHPPGGPGGGMGRSGGGMGPGGGMGGPGGGMDGGPGGRHHRDGGSDPPGGGSGQPGSRWRDRMALKLRDTGYCASGYDELGENRDAGHLQVWGQCKDRATDADRVRFPNPPG